MGTIRLQQRGFELHKRTCGLEGDAGSARVQSGLAGAEERRSESRSGRRARAADKRGEARGEGGEEGG
ncbi:hypothetical protein Ahy_B02g060908 isoform B [Arachis hypogaea]|uniref:Uncharacterized protein n=1 Tax=Arachis hypogaea TaxID=3818 RepID=A0A445AJL9_ARAHY|nr:hypothetical protein Ahy_B02g060908 isoform B [Arachis hypogaea]